MTTIHFDLQSKRFVIGMSQSSSCILHLEGAGAKDPRWYPGFRANRIANVCYNVLHRISSRHDVGWREVEAMKDLNWGI
jgi:hypothetical protein